MWLLLELEKHGSRAKVTCSVFSYIRGRCILSMSFEKKEPFVVIIESLEEDPRGVDGMTPLCDLHYVGLMKRTLTKAFCILTY